MYFIYDVESTRLVRIRRNGYWQNASYKTESAAKAGMTLLKSRGTDVSKLAIAEDEEFNKIEKFVIVKSLMTGEPVRIPVNTPLCCDPSSETYWSC